MTAGTIHDLRSERDAYDAGGERRPLGPYAVLMGLYGAGVAGLSLLARRSGLPERIGLADLALASVATHKLSRLLAKDKVTSPLRAPFTTYKGPSSASEVQEEPRAGGMRQAVGELLGCPFCVGQWVATGFAFGLVLQPRATRLVASVFSTLAAADFLQLAYAAAQQKAEG